ncbi:MAG: c-type cytochrome [Ginsengibacter sp.]
MKKALLFTFSFITIIVITTAFMPTDGPKYKNLKILPKNISKEQLDSVMHHFAMSLGQKCTFCHVRNEQDKSWDFASDAIPDKLIARKMMLMAAKINKQYFSDEQNKAKVLSVACYTCHHGQAIPETKPPMPQRDSLRNRPQPLTLDTMIRDTIRMHRDSLPH